MDRCGVRRSCGFAVDKCLSGGLGLELQPKTNVTFGVLASLVALTSLLSTFGCNNKQVGNDVMATVNGRNITRTEVQKFYNVQVAGSPQQPSAEQADTLRLKVISDLIDNEILMQRAEKLGLLATDEEVNAKLTGDQGALHPGAIRPAPERAAAYPGRL